MSFEKKKILAIVGAAVILIASVAVSYTAGYSRGYSSRNITLQDNKDDEEQDSDSAEIDLDEDEIKPLEEDTISVLCCGVDNSEKLTDVVMYALFDTRKGTVDILRIPRDTFVGSAFPTGKVNAIYGHPQDGMTGIETLENYLEENWNLDVDYYAIIDLNGVRSIVDDLGGVTMNIEQQINYLPGKVLYPGEQTLDGEQAEWILRYRSGYANGDLGRIDTQTSFIKAAIQQVKNMGRMKCLPILMKHYNDVDTDMPLKKMIAVASNLFELDVDDIQMHVVPGQGTMYYSYAVYAVDAEELAEVLNENFASAGETFSADTMKVANPHGGSSYRGQSSSSQSSNQNYNQNSSGTSWNNGQGSYQQSSDSQQNNGSGQQTSQQYLYDENGNPLYRLDSNGDPIYDYDKDGKIVYIYEQENQREEQEQENKTSQTKDGRKVIKSKTNQEAEQQQEEQEDKTSQTKDGRKVVKSKTNQEAEQKADSE